MAWTTANLTLLPNLLAGVALVGLGIWLLVLDRRSSPTLALATFVSVYGTSILCATLVLPLEEETAALRVSFAVPFSAGIGAFLWLAAVYPHVRTWFGAGRRGLLAVVCAALIPVVVLLAVPGSRGQLAILPDGSMRWLVPGLSSLASGIGNLLGSVVLLLYARDFVREGPGTERRSLLLIVLGWGLIMLHFDTQNPLRHLFGGAPIRSQYEMAHAVLSTAGLVPATLAYTLLARIAGGRHDPELTRFARSAAAILPLGVATGVVAAIGPSRIGVLAIGPALDGVWRIAFPALLSYGILRHRFMGLDAKVNWTIRRGTVAAILIATFVVVSEIARNIFSAQYGPILGGIAAGLLIFAIRPLEKLAERLADATAPPRPARRATSPERSREEYRRAVRVALGGGISGERDERALAELATVLGLTPRDALDARLEIERELRGGAAASGLSEGVSPSRRL